MNVQFKPEAFILGVKGQTNRYKSYFYLETIGLFARNWKKWKIDFRIGWLELYGIMEIMLIIINFRIRFFLLIVMGTGEGELFE